MRARANDVSFMAAAVCSALSVLFLALAPHCPVPAPETMISVQHNTSDGSLRLDTATARPVLREGELLIKVKGHTIYFCSKGQCYASTVSRLHVSFCCR